MVKDTLDISRVIRCLFAHFDPLTSGLSMNGQACDIWHGHQVASHGIIPLTTCPHHQGQCLAHHSDSWLITSCNELVSARLWGSCRIDFLDQFGLFSVSLQSYFSREVIWEDDILLSVDTTYREIVSKIGFIASNSVHNWQLDLEHKRQHAQKFLGSVVKYLISQNIYILHLWLSP